MYIYESHLGRLYTSDERLSFEELYCEACGDSDHLLGYAETREEAKEILTVLGWYDLEDKYVQDFILNGWEE